MRVLILGCGDVGLRLARQISDRVNCIAVIRRDEQRGPVRQAGAQAVVFDLDAPGRRRRPERIAEYLVYLAPPDASRTGDPRLAASLARARMRRRHLGSAGLPAGRRLSYTSTTGVFGDAAGRELTETDPPRPTSERAMRRAAAEQQVRRAARSPGRHRRPSHVLGVPVSGSIFRAPGIYAQDRLPVRRLQQQLPCFLPGEDGYSNRIHAADLARVLWLGLFRGATTRTYITTDGQAIRMGDYFDQVADALGLQRPPRLPAEDVKAQVSAMAWSFMRESRRLSNARLTHELRIRLRYPTLSDTLATLPPPDAAPADPGANPTTRDI